MCSTVHLKPCPFCGFQLPADEGDGLIDVLYPSGRWREDAGFRHYLLPGDKREGHGEVWHIGCTQNMGGCGASLMADSRDEAKAAWNRRSDGDRLRQGDLTAAEYLAKVEADPKRAAALQRAREKHAHGVRVSTNQQKE